MPTYRTWNCKPSDTYLPFYQEYYTNARLIGSHARAVTGPRPHMNGSNKRGILSLAMVLMMLMSAFVGAASAAPSWDSETTDDSSTSDVTGDTTVTFAVDGDGNLSIEAIDANSSELYAVVEDADGNVIYDEAMESQEAADHFVKVIEHSDLDDAPVRNGETTDVTLTIYNGSDYDTAESVTATLSLDNEEERSVYTLYESAFDGEGTDFGELNTEDAWFGLGEDKDLASLDVDEAPISGNQSTVEVHLKDSDARERFDKVVTSNHEAGDRLFLPLTADGKYVPVYYEEADSDHDDDDAYVTYDDATGVFTFHTVEDSDFEGDSFVDFEVASNEEMGLYAVYKTFGFDALQERISL